MEEPDHHRCKKSVDDALAGICDVMLLTNRQQPFNLLQVLPLGFIVENVGLLTCENARATTALVDADHRNTHRPRTVADAQLYVLVMRFDVFFQQTVLHYQVKRV